MEIRIDPKGIWYHGSPVEIGVDVVQHPRTVMDKNAEWLTCRELKVRLITELG